MKKLLTMFLVVLLTSSTHGIFFTAIIDVSAEQGETWPNMDLNGDRKINIYDAVEYMRLHYVGYDHISDTYQWSFADPFDSAMANRIIQDALSVEGIRNKYKDATVANIVGKGIGLKDLNGVVHPINTIKDAAAWVIEMMMKDKSYIMSLLHGPLEWIVNHYPEILSPSEATMFSSDLADYMVQTGEEWLKKLSTTEWKVAKNWKFDTSLSDKLSVYAKRIKLVFKLGTLVDASIKHVLVLWEILNSDTILEMVKTHEYEVEIIKWSVDVAGRFITDALSEVVAAKGAVLLMVGAGLATANPAIAVGVGIAGYIFIKTTVSEMLEAMINWVEDAVTTRSEVLWHINPLFKYINLKLTGDPRRPIRPMKVKIISIADKDGDYIIPWGDGKPGEDVEVSVQNTGVQDINLRVTPTVIPTNWQIDDKQWDLDNYIEFSLKVGEKKSATFHVTSYTKEYNLWDPLHLDGYKIHPGENPGVFYFKFEHDEHLEWWDIGDWFPGGLVRLFDADVSAKFFNYVDFEVVAVAGKLEYERGEIASITVTVKNCRQARTHFSIAIIIRDPHGEWEKYRDQITVVPKDGTLDSGESSDFAASWLVPSDALVGEYQIGVVLWEKLPHVCRFFIDNLEWQQIFSVYQMYIIYPTTSQPADAGDYESPQRINAFVAGLPRYLWVRAFLGINNAPTFVATVGGRKALDVSITSKFGGFGLSILPPSQNDEGLYDLTISAVFGDVSTSATQLKAVKYAKALPTEPILKGLAWLRTSQYSDGSWRNSVGVTALCTLAFLNAGYDETDTTVSKAINYILSNVKPDGSIYITHPTYETSLAMLPLIATRNDAYKTVIENAKNWLVNSQWDEDCLWGSVTKDNWYYGGFGYGWANRPDLSNTQFALLALDAAGLPKNDPLWKKVQVFLHRCQNVNFSIALNIDGEEYKVQPFNHQGGYDGGFIYHPGTSLAGGQKSYGSMTGAGIWGLLLSGVKMGDKRVQAALDWVRNHYTWDGNPGMPDPTSFQYYYYLSMAKALTMTGLTAIDKHDWYKELYDKLAALQRPEGYWVNSNSWAMEDVAEYITASAILSLQTRAAAPPVQRLSYLTFILRSNCLLRVIDSEGRSVGYNYVTGLGENQVPTAVYSGPFMEPQYIVIIYPQAETYRLELIGISEGPYELTIQGNYGEEITDKFEYAGEIKPAELYGCDVTVTAIVGPIDVYASPPEFEEIIDNIPPTTTLSISEPKYVSSTGNIYVSSATQFTLITEDNPGGIGVASTFYRVYNVSYNTGWLNYFVPFSLAHLMDGQYNLTFYSVDVAGNAEEAKQITIYLDNAAPSLYVGVISSRVYAGGSTVFNLTVSDMGSGVCNVGLYVDGELVANWTASGVYTFVSEPLKEGKHSFYAVAVDNLGNTVRSDVYEFEVFPRLPSRLIVVFAVVAIIACLVIALLFAAKRGEAKRVGRGYVTRPSYPSGAVRACPLCGGVLRYDSKSNKW